MNSHRLNTRASIARAARLNLITASDDAILAQLRATARADMIDDCVELTSGFLGGLIIVAGMVGSFLYLSA